MATKASKATKRRPVRKAAPRMPKMLTPEQAMDMYKANARLALDVINAAIEGAERLRRKQFEGAEAARAFQKKHVRAAGQATDAQSLMALGQGAAQEALEKSMHYWGEMFDLIVEIQKRLFALLEEQTRDVPGVREARAAMALLPDLGQFQKVVSAMQGVVSSGGSAFESMQRVMGDFARIAQGAMPPGSRR
jgi:phasin family protein